MRMSVHLHGDDWFYIRRDRPTLRTLYGSALYEMRYATRARRMISQAALVPLESLACLLATEAYGMIPGDGAVTPERVSPGRGSAGGRYETRARRASSVLFVAPGKDAARGPLHDEFVRHVLTTHRDAELWCVSDHREESESVRRLKTRPMGSSPGCPSCRVFCLPSSYEGSGLPYVEAMSRGAPVVATPDPGSRFLAREGGDGTLVADDRVGIRSRGRLERGTPRRARGSGAPASGRVHMGARRRAP